MPHETLTLTATPASTPAVGDAAAGGHPQRPDEPTTTELRSRRLKLFRWLAVGVIALAGYSLTVPWYSTAIGTDAAGQPGGVTVRSSNWAQAPGVAATATLTGWGLTHRPQPVAMPDMGPAQVVAEPASTGGLTTPVAYLIVAALLGIAAVSSRLTAVGLLATYLGWHAQGALDTLNGVMVGTSGGQAYTHQMAGVGYARAGIWVLILGMAAASLQMHLVNRELRKEKVAAAKAAGHAVRPTLFERVEAMALAGLSRLERHVPGHEHGAEHGQR